MIWEKRHSSFETRYSSLEMSVWYLTFEWYGQCSVNQSSTCDPQCDSTMYFVQQFPYYALWVHKAMCFLSTMNVWGNQWHACKTFGIAPHFLLVLRNLWKICIFHGDYRWKSRFARVCLRWFKGAFWLNM